MAIIGVVLAGTTQLFMSAMKSQNDQTNRVQAQQDARLALDQLRREIHCASALTTPSGYPASSITITLGSYCPTAGGATTVTWCTRSSAASRRAALHALAVHGPGQLLDLAPIAPPTKWAWDLVDKVDAPSISAGRIFNTVSLGPATLTQASTGGTLAAGRYSYAVTAVLSGGEEVPGRAASRRSVRPARPDQPQLVAVFGSGVVQRVRLGRRRPAPIEERHLGHVVHRHRADQAQDNPLAIPARRSMSPAPRTSTRVCEHDRLRAVGPRHLHRRTAGSFPGCTGGQPGQYPVNTPVISGSSARPPRAALAVSLAIDRRLRPSQRFVLLDTIVLRNTQAY